MRGELTENSSWSIITGETGLAHTRTKLVLDTWQRIGTPTDDREHEGRGKEWRCGLEKSRMKDVGETSGGAYPLSITRAATSSAGGIDVSDCSSMMKGTRRPAPDGSERGMGRLTLHSDGLCGWVKEKGPVKITSKMRS